MRPHELSPGTTTSAITATALGLIVALAGTMWHGFIYYFSASVYLPWGAVLALILTFAATIWLVSHTRRAWTGGVMGFTLFLALMYMAFGRASEGSMLVFMNTEYAPGAAGTLWSMGSLVSVAAGILVAGFVGARSTSESARR
ncbi:hypothetical protein [Rothia sp. ZJ932]|uniref:hypothetical protein n=1 Tax=Rothia sp. ZJ932 TaxID=2810516 RepID=UPI0019687385|nr:hypothetical protein [Rothia sp. ZJ932]QRZ62186.1 hypothetical protein JR346_03475 [Rothia sp. ZJ932]